MSGQAKDEQIYDFLTLLSDKGESPDEIAGGVFVLRNKAKAVNIEGNVIDTCGTGGDGKNTLNISTASALLLASYGIKVTPHFFYDHVSLAVSYTHLTLPTIYSV